MNTTPGPWSLTRFAKNGKPEKYMTVISQYNHVARVFDNPPGAPSPVNGADNARLIAAAPDLLEVADMLDDLLCLLDGKNRPEIIEKKIRQYGARAREVIKAVQS